MADEEFPNTFAPNLDNKHLNVEDIIVVSKQVPYVSMHCPSTYKTKFVKGWMKSNSKDRQPKN